MSVKDKYELLKKTHHLPDFKEIDNEFEIRRIDEEEPFLLRAILDRILEKLDIITKILISILQPDSTSLSDLFECKLFEDEEKKKIYELYKKIRTIQNGMLEVLFFTDEKKEADFIKYIFSEWHSIKKEIIPIITKTKKSWENEIIKKEELDYLG